MMVLKLKKPNWPLAGFGAWLVIMVGSLLLSGCQTAGNDPMSLVKIPMTEHAAMENTQAQRNEILAGNIAYDPITGEIRYSLEQEALVRIRMGIRDGGPLLGHVLDWDPRPAGDHVEVWDKKDSTGRVNFESINGLMFVISCLPAEPKNRVGYNPKIKGYKKSPEVKVSFPDSSVHTDNGTPVLSGISPVRISLDPEDAAWLAEVKFEVGLYIDYVFLMEDEEGVNPFTYFLDTTRMNDGEHVLTANVVSYAGEVGAKNIRVFVRNKDIVKSERRAYCL